MVKTLAFGVNNVLNYGGENVPSATHLCMLMES